MREIKFRVFGHCTNEMYYPGKDSTQLLFGIKGSAWSLWDETEEICDEGDGELLEYTGLKDKNSVEIYEGDVVQITEDPVFAGEEDLTGVVKFYECAFWIENEKEEKAYPLFNEISEREVIGNIYENPKLLEVAK